MVIKMNIKKVIAFLLAVLIVIPFTVSCDKDSKTALTAGGFDVPYHLFRYIVVNARYDIEKEYGENVWKSDKADGAKAELEKNIKDAIADLYTFCALGADFDLKWDSEVIAAEADQEYAAIRGEYDSDKDFEKALEELAMTKDTLIFLTSNTILKDSVYSAMITADEHFDDDDYFTSIFEGDEFIRVKQILVGGDNAGTDEANLKKAREIKEQLDSGADFDKLCREYNNDLFMFENDDGYYIMRGTRNFEFEEAAFSLNVGEVSDIVKTDAGYSIIKRYEKDPDYISDNFTSLKDEYYESKFSIMYESKYESVYSSISSFTENYDITTLD